MRFFMSRRLIMGLFLLTLFSALSLGSNHLFARGGGGGGHGGGGHGGGHGGNWGGHGGHGGDWGGHRGDWGHHGDWDRGSNNYYGGYGYGVGVYGLNNNYPYYNSGYNSYDSYPSSTSPYSNYYYDTEGSNYLYQQ
jgi:hypothetical protein